MKIQFNLILFILLAPIFCRAQLCFVDSLSQLPIPALNIYHSSGTLIGLTDKNGNIQFLEGVDKNSMLPSTVTAQHISYTSKKIHLLPNDEQKTFFMSPRSNLITDIVITAKPKDVVVLKGYYRSLETFNLQQKYFSDGIIEFYIPLVKGKPKYKLIDYRVFVDSIVIADYNDKMGPFFQIPRFTKMYTKNLSDRLTTLSRENYGENQIRLKKDGKEVGHITTSNDGNNMQLYIDKVLPDSVKNQKILRLEARTFQNVDIENYSSTMSKNVSPFDLTSIYQNIVATIKRKPEIGHLPYEALNEFYVLERRYMTLKEYKAIEKRLTGNIYKTPIKSSYSDKFWEDENILDLPAIPKGLKDKLGDSMRLLN